MMRTINAVNFMVETLTHEMDLTLWTDDAELATTDIDSIAYPELVLERVWQLPALCTDLDAIDEAEVLDGQCRITDDGYHFGLTAVEEDDLTVVVDAPANWQEAFTLK